MCPGGVEHYYELSGTMSQQQELISIKLSTLICWLTVRKLNIEGQLPLPPPPGPHSQALTEVTLWMDTGDDRQKLHYGWIQG